MSANKFDVDRPDDDGFNSEYDAEFVNVVKPKKTVRAVAQRGTLFVLDMYGKFVIINSDKQGKDSVLGIMPKAEKPSFVDELVKSGEYRYLQPPIVLDLPPVQKDALSASGGGAVLVPSNIRNRKEEESKWETTNLRP